jgi:Cyclin, N-terminal domain
MLPFNYLDSSHDVSDSIERLNTMYKQELSTYNIPKTDGPMQLDGMNHTGESSVIDICDCRYKMAVWCFDLVEFCQMSSNTVEIAMSILDRFIFTSCETEWINRSDTVRTLCSQARSSAWANKKAYQLVAMSAMYTAVKINEAIAFDPPTVSAKLSRDTYSALQIENTEALLLESLVWKVNQPSVLAFVHEYILLMNPILQQIAKHCHRTQLFLTDSCMQESFMDAIHRQSKLSILDFNFITVPASIRAVCCIVNALESFDFHDTIIADVEEVMLKTNQCYQTSENRLFYCSTRQVMHQMFLSNEVSSTSNFLLCRTNVQNEGMPTHNEIAENPYVLQPYETALQVSCKMKTLAILSPKNGEDDEAKSCNAHINSQLYPHNNADIIACIIPTSRIIRNEEIEFAQIASPSSTMQCGYEN